MMTDYQEFPLGADALGFICRRLAMGHSLGRWLLERPDLAKGRITTRLPRSVDPKLVEDLESGGILPAPPAQHRVGVSPRGTTHSMREIPNTDDDLTSVIGRFLGEVGGRCCVFENWLARASDPWLASAASCIRVFGEEVYHVLCDRDSDIDAIRATIREARGIPVTIGVLSSWSADPRHPRREPLSEDELRGIAERATKILIGAYDGEGYLIWSRSTQENETP